MDVVADQGQCDQVIVLLHSRILLLVDPDDLQGLRVPDEFQVNVLVEGEKYVAQTFQLAEVTLLKT